MRIAIGADERTVLTDFLIKELYGRGHSIGTFGPLNADGNETEQAQQWAEVGRKVGEAIATGDYEQGIVCCWTGTGISIAANKVEGIRAALCTDAPTAAGARQWNDANVLALSLRLVSLPVAKEILDAWFSTDFDESERANVNRC